MRRREVGIIRRAIGVGMGGCDVRRTRGDRDRTGEVDLLPTTRALVGESGGRKQSTRGRPQVRDMGTRVLWPLVEADSRDRAVSGGRELDAELHRAVVADRDIGWRIGGGEPGL